MVLGIGAPSLLGDYTIDVASGIDWVLRRISSDGMRL